MHRAEQIVQQIAALHIASVLLQNASVFTDRVQSLNPEELKVPAINIDTGPDAPYSETGQQNIAFIDSLLEIIVTLYATGVDEPDVKRQLMDLRRASHVVMLGTAQLGLAFVSLARYGGANPPVISVSGQTAGSMETRWTIQYRMNLTDPA